MAKSWSPEEKVQAKEMLDSGGWSLSEIALHFGVSYDSIHWAIRSAPELEDTPGNRLLDSPFPRFNNPLTTEGDTLVIPDLEIPFHHAEFVNNVLDLAQAWEIPNLVLAGDFMHFQSLSKFDPPWTTDRTAMPPHVAMEIKIGRDVLQRIGKNFSQVDFHLGNHEGRFLRAVGSPFFPEDMLASLKSEGAPLWRIAPYYYGYVVSEGVKYQIEHPKGSALSTARFLADKFQNHILMGHSHRVTMNYSRGGHYFAYEIGACVDEDRLAYVGQRHTHAPAHQLGAAIIRNGHCWLLTEHVDWEALRYAKPRTQDVLPEQE